jgi:hypothetical protein
MNTASRDWILEITDWELLQWKPCSCGSVGIRFKFEVKDEGTNQSKCTTFYRCLRCGREWSESETDWS